MGVLPNKASGAQPIQIVKIEIILINRMFFFRQFHIQIPQLSHENESTMLNFESLDPVNISNELSVINLQPVSDTFQIVSNLL